MRVLRIIIRLFCSLACGTAFGFGFFYGGLVIDEAKIAELGTQFTTDQNKLNLLGQATTSAQDQQNTLLALQTAINSGSGMQPYTMVGSYSIDLDRQKAIDAFALNLGSSSSKKILTEYLQRVNDRDKWIAAYSQRVKKLADAQGNNSTTLENVAVATSQLATANMDIRLNAINEAADSTGIHAIQRENLNIIREQKAETDTLDAAMSNK